MRGLASILALAAVVCLLAGCAAGRFVVGAPSRQSEHPARTLLVKRCGGCHEVPEPASMSASAWHRSLERMKLRMRLPAADWDSLAEMPTRP